MTLTPKFVTLVVSTLLLVGTQSFVPVQLCSSHSKWITSTKMIFRQDVDERQQQQQDKLKSKTSQLGSSRQNKNGILPSLSLLEKQDETSRSSTILSSSNTESIEFVDDDEDKGEMSLFVARGILLLVAAIWGTNFAVREGPTLRVLRRRTEKRAFIY